MQRLKESSLVFNASAILSVGFVSCKLAAFRFKAGNFPNTWVILPTNLKDTSFETERGSKKQKKRSIFKKEKTLHITDLLILNFFLFFFSRLLSSLQVNGVHLCFPFTYHFVLTQPIFFLTDTFSVFLSFFAFSTATGSTHSFSPQRVEHNPHTIQKADGKK